MRLVYTPHLGITQQEIQNIANEFNSTILGKTINAKVDNSRVVLVGDIHRDEKKALLGTLCAIECKNDPSIYDSIYKPFIT